MQPGSKNDKKDQDMKHLKMNLVLVLLVNCLFIVHANAQYALPDYAFGNGGGIISGSGNHIAGILGQSAIGITSNTENRISSGFWKMVGNEPTGLENITENHGFGLDQNFPNPFSLSTIIRYTLPRSSSVAIKLFDLQGREIITLIDAKLPQGEHTVRFNANGISAGVYMYRLESNGVVISRKLNVMK